MLSCPSSVRIQGGSPESDGGGGALAGQTWKKLQTTQTPIEDFFNNLLQFGDKKHDKTEGILSISIEFWTL